MAALAVCSCNDTTLAPADARHPGYHLQLAAGDSLRGFAGEPVAGVEVQVVRRSGEPVDGVRLWWRIEAGGGRLGSADGVSHDSGLASAEWILGPHLWVPQVLWVGIEEGDSTRLQAMAAIPSEIAITADSSVLAVDSIGAAITIPITLAVSLPDGTPISGAVVEFDVVTGGGRVWPLTALTDSIGQVAGEWWLGNVAGTQELLARVKRRTGELISTHQFLAEVLPGGPARLGAVPDTIHFASIQDTILPPVQVYDRAGNLLSTTCYWFSNDPAVVLGTGSSGLVSIDNGSGSVRVQCGGLNASVPVTVAQVPVAVVADSDTMTLNWLGQSRTTGARVVDARTVELRGAQVAWQAAPGGAVTVDSTGLIVAVAPGTAEVVAAHQGLADTVLVTIRQVPATISVVPAVDTMDLHAALRPTVAVADSGGSAIAAPSLQVLPADSSIIGILPNGDESADLPGATTVTYRAGPAATVVDRVVEGVALLAGGQRVVAAGALPDTVPFTLTNGRIRLSWSTAMWEIASVEMDVRLGTTWLPANARHWGDWVYLASSVRTLPTGMRVAEYSNDRIGLEMRFDDHWFLPKTVGLPDTLSDRPYPFVRTLWLRKGDNGYYSWIDLFDDLQLQIVEHETGFGGLWGPATIRTNQLAMRTDTLATTVTYNGNPGLPVMGSLVDAAEFILDGDPVRRVLVPLPEAPFITPVFPGWGYGSVYRYASPSRSFGVYMYANGVGDGTVVPSICQAAWTNAPFPLPAVSPAQLASCGPAGP